MNQKLNQLIEPHLKLYFFLTLVFVLLDLIFCPPLALAELLVIIFLAIYLTMMRNHRKKQAAAIIGKLLEQLNQTNKEVLLNSPFPMVIFRLNTEEIIWSNDRFLAVTGQEQHLFDTKISVALPNFDFTWLREGEHCSPVECSVAGRRYMVFGTTTSVERGSADTLATTYWIDVTELSQGCELYHETRPQVSIITIDNYEDLMRNLPDSSRSTLRANIELELVHWAESADGLVLRYDRDHYLFLFESQYLDLFKKEKFSILDAIHKIVSPNGLSVSLSIGIGIDAGFNDMFMYASQALDMALSRGGDQAVVKNRFTFEFYGGRSKEQERRTKVKSRVTAGALEELISASPQVYVMGHRFADLDAVGAAVGITAICRKNGTPVRILKEHYEVPGTIMIQELMHVPEYEDVFIYEEEAFANRTDDTLLVVVDTNRPSQVCSPSLLDACQKVAVIDHHRRAADYIQDAVLNYQEPYASSASELITELIQYTIEPSDLLRMEAEALMAGIVLDTKYFTMRTGGRTFEAAAFLRRCGADTVEVKRLFQNNLEDTITKYNVLQAVRFYHEGVAVAAVNFPVSRVIAAQAADEMLNIEGVGASFVLYFKDGTVYISGRSTGDVNVQVILEDLGGGGNAAAAGAQIKGETMNDVSAQLKAAIKKYYNNDSDSV